MGNGIHSMFGIEPQCVRGKTSLNERAPSQISEEQWLREIQRIRSKHGEMSNVELYEHAQETVVKPRRKAWCRLLWQAYRARRRVRPCRLGAKRVPQP